MLPDKKSVVSTALHAELKEEFEGKKFLLLMNESTDIAIQKHLCIVVRFFLENVGIKTAFLGLLPVLSATAESLFDGLKTKLCEYTLNF